VREYQGGGYGFANRDGIEIHLGTVPDPNSVVARHSAYLWVDDSDALAQEWLAVGAEVHMPEDTEWGQHEGAVVDLDATFSGLDRQSIDWVSPFAGTWCQPAALRGRLEAPVNFNQRFKCVASYTRHL
jgi:hypothetical protein